VNELLRYRDLLWMMTWRDIRIKYKQSILGVMWAVLMPAIIVGAGILVKFALARLSARSMDLQDVATVSVKAIPWAFVVASLRFTSTSLISNATLVTKIYMPREIFPLAAVASQLFDLTVACVVLTAIFSAAGIGASWQLLWILPLVGVLVILMVGLGLLVSSGSLFFRDVKYIVEVLVTFAIFFTPVFYDSEMFGEQAFLLKLNPVTPILEGLSRTVVFHRPPEIFWISYSFIVAVATCGASYLLFKKVEPSFAECI